MFHVRLLRRAFIGAVLVWAVALPAAAFAASRPRASAPESLFALLIYGVGSAICHQRPERSFHLWGRQLPVCARCVGIYVGAAVAVLVVALKRSARAFALNPRVDDPPEGARRLQPSGRFRPSGRLQPSARVAIVAAMPTAATLAFEWTTGVTPGNWIRATAGLVLGAAVAWVVAAELVETPEVN